MSQQTPDERRCSCAKCNSALETPYIPLACPKCGSTEFRDESGMVMEFKFTRDAPVEPSPAIAIVWDADLLTEDEYARLVVALGDLVRAEGGQGVERLRSRGIGIPAEAWAPS